MKPQRPQQGSRHEMAQALVDSVYAKPDAENVARLINFTAYEADPEMQKAVAAALAAHIAAAQQITSPMDLNAAVLEPRMRVDGTEMALIYGKALGFVAVDAMPEVRTQLRAGDQVALKPVEDRGVVITRIIGSYPADTVKRVERVLPGGDKLLVTDQGGEKHVLTIAQELRGHPDLGGGAEVFCARDAGLALSLHEAAQDDRSLHLLEDLPPRTLDDLGGQPDVKRQLKRMLALMTTPPGELAAYGLARSQLVLFAGPPGSGKTWAALILASILQQTLKIAVVFVKGPEFLNPLVGASESAIRGLFEKLSHLAARHDLVYVVWDEFEALFGARGRRISSTIVDETLVQTLIAEVDGLDKSSLTNVWLVAISNRPELIDSAIMREGRLGAKVVFTTLQSEPAACEVAAIHLRERLLADGLSPRVAAERLAAYAWAGPEGQGLPVAAIRLRDGRRELLTGRQILTGAVIKGSIDRAAEKAWYRAHNGGTRGIQVADLCRGIEESVTSLPLSPDNLGEYLGWPPDQVARVLEVEPLANRGARR
jgi:proteasome-associated ATPase